MKEKYILWIAISLGAYFLTSVVTKIFKNESDGNSIKQEVNLAIENISFIFESAFCILAIYFVTKLRITLVRPVFYIELVLLAIIVISFLVNLVKAIKDYLVYSKTGTIWTLIFIQFIKSIVIAYLVYNYYCIYIA